MKSFILLFTLGLLSACSSNRHEKENSYPKFVIRSSTGSYDSITKILKYQQPNPFFRNDKFIVYRVDMGEWGGFVVFKDSISKKKYWFPQSTILAFGQSDSSYILHCNTNHGLHGEITEIIQPKELPELCDTCKLPNGFKADTIAKEILRRQNVVRQYSDMNDTVLSLVGVFTNSNKLFSIHSGQWFGGKNNVTILASLNLDKKKYEIIDTIMNSRIYSTQERPWPGHAPVNDIFSSTQYIPFSDNKKKGYIIISKDTISIVTEIIKRTE